MSQKSATEKALTEQISVTEGPPGTGKTQTILNIIANAVINGKTVAVVDEQEKWFFSIVDVIEVLTGSDRPRKYWSDLKRTLKVEGSQFSEKIGQLKMLSADGKYYNTDVADTEEILRLIQSIPSPNAEPFKTS